MKAADYYDVQAEQSDDEEMSEGDESDGDRDEYEITQGEVRHTIITLSPHCHTFAVLWYPRRPLLTSD